MLLVEVRMTALETVVYSRHATVKKLATNQTRETLHARVVVSRNVKGLLAS